MKHFKVAILQLDVVSPDTALRAMKQVIPPNTQFFDSLSMHPLTTVDELFYMGNQYAMLEHDIVTATKRMVASTSDSQSYDGTKGNRGQDKQDMRGKHDSGDSSSTGRHNETNHLGGQAAMNQTRENSVEQTRFTIPPSQLLPIIQSLQGFEWPRPQKDYLEGRDKS